MSDNELGLFLRLRREAVTPAEVGLPAGPRRRAVGLRRSEVAALADVSVEYVTRLEQGRDRRPSPQVLATIADALRLTASERAHLYRLTKAADPGFNCRGDTTPARTVRPTVQALLDRLEPTPAVLLNRLSDILAYTSGYERLAGPIGLLDATPAQPRPIRLHRQPGTEHVPRLGPHRRRAGRRAQAGPVPGGPARRRPGRGADRHRR